MMLYVVVLIAEDGTLTVMGTPIGRSFRSEAAAERLADKWRAVPFTEVSVRLVSTASTPDEDES